ncbi:thioredoxin-like protein [Aspergillus crustosus]
MPLLNDFSLPESASALDLDLSGSTGPFFLSFHASPDPTTGKPWCPDVIAALPNLTEIFSSPDSPQAAFVNVGQREQWRDPSNVVRKKWNVNSVPTLVRFEKGEEGVREVGRLVEAEILDRKRLKSFVTGAGMRRCEDDAYAF